jgi:hypothetical protein
MTTPIEYRTFWSSVVGVSSANAGTANSTIRTTMISLRIYSLSITMIFAKSFLRLTYVISGEQYCMSIVGTGVSVLTANTSGNDTPIAGTSVQPGLTLARAS